MLAVSGRVDTEQKRVEEWFLFDTVRISELFWRERLSIFEY
jgi:hypothetical protein